MTNTNAVSIIKECADRLTEGAHLNAPIPKALALEMLSRAAGYQNWHEANQDLSRETPTRGQLLAPQNLSALAEPLSVECMKRLLDRLPVVVSCTETGMLQVSRHLASYASKTTSSMILCYEDSISNATPYYRFYRTARAAKLDDYYFEVIERLEFTDAGECTGPQDIAMKIMQEVTPKLARCPEWHAGYSLTIYAMQALRCNFENFTYSKDILARYESAIPKSMLEGAGKIEWFLHDNRDPLRAIAAAVDSLAPYASAKPICDAWKARFKAWGLKNFKFKRGGKAKDPSSALTASALRVQEALAKMLQPA